MGERLRLLFCDHLNLARGKYLPASKIGDGGSRFCQSTFGVTYDKDLLPSPGSKLLEGLPDMEARYRAADIRNGWEPDTKVVVGSLFQTDGTPVAQCGRGALQRAVADWGALGLAPQVGIELEAYAFEIGEDGVLAPYDTPGAYVYSTGPFSDPRGFTDAIWEAAEEAGFPLEVMTSEFDHPQFEFTLTYADALRAADEIFLFRLMAREIALQHGILLTFMPKPILEKGGCGVHVNFSFTDGDGRNALARGMPADAPPLSDLTRGCIAGLMHHHRGMCALMAPSVNSYARLQPAGLAGVWQNWGIDHRGVTVRLTETSGKAARIEHRLGDGAANIYTHVATVLQAARLGVVNGYECPPAETGDCLESQDATIRAPESLAEALDALEADTALCAAVGQGLCDNLVFMKRDEIDKTAALEGAALRDFYIHYL